MCNDEELRKEVHVRLDKGRTELADVLGLKKTQTQNRINALNREARSMLDALKEAGSKGSRIVTDRMSELETEIDELRQKSGRIDEQLRGLSESVGRVATAINMLNGFDELWEALLPEERMDLLYLIIERIDIDEPAGKLEMKLHDLAAPFPPLDKAAGADA